ncbi:BTAD domain-containing putative transcriptional regulator [Streptomyces sp. NPDC051214]|uniref:AfsR/SARP family transcriptional regulator n=1 Tax=Streptomyces sp. NPDC051214 TaxID=3155282 RepID=UPI003413E651
MQFEPPRVHERGHPADTVRFSVLGPVRAWRGTEQLPTGSPQQRALLAALLLRDGRVATASELIDAIWGDSPPSPALAAVRTYASRLRKAFPPGLLASISGGYAIRLPVPAEALDLAAAEHLWSETQKARTAGERSRARSLLDTALSLWDGEPLANVPGPYAETQRTRLEEWRLQLLETRMDLDLELGHHGAVVSELTALTAQHPLRERLRELLMLALYRAGRQAEALAVYADTRRLLTTELGIDPRPELRELQMRILQADTDLAGPVAPARESTTMAVRLDQLPATVPDFTGKDALVAELSQALSSTERRGMTVSALAGIGGAGKTTLAVHVAHGLRASFPDGQLFVDLQGTGARAADPEAVLGTFLRALGTPDSAIPDTLEERQALYRSILADRRILVLLDNARDVAQVKPLLPGFGKCAALITSRVRMVDLPAAHLVDLDVMSPEEALLLFKRIVGAERVAPERHAALDVVAACGFLPLAIRIAASRLAARRTWTVSVLAAKLADKRRRLDELQAGDLAVKATFELDYGALEPAQARAFRLLGLADGPDISLSSAAAMLDLPLEPTEDLLESLVDTSLLESAAPGRYRYHDLVRLYARACAERDELPPSQRAAALSRLLDFHLASASQAYARAHPGDTTVGYFAPTYNAGLSFGDDATARAWLHSESDCVLACVQQSLTPDSLGRSVDLLLAAKELAEPGANPGLYESVAAAVCTAARDAGDVRAEGRARTALAGVLLLSGRLEEADEEARRAVRLAEESGDPLPQCWATHDLGLIAMHAGRHAEGERYLRQAVDTFRALGNRAGEADALGNLARVHLATGHSAGAVELARRALAMHDDMGLRVRGAHARYVLGLAYTRTGQYDDATFELRLALEVFRAQHEQTWEGQTLFRLAEVHMARGRFADAAADAELALSLLTGPGRARHRAGVLTLLGRALNGIGHTDRARACWEEALTLFDQLGSAATEETVAWRRQAAAHLHGAGTTRWSGEP